MTADQAEYIALTIASPPGMYWRCQGGKYDKTINMPKQFLKAATTYAMRGHKAERNVLARGLDRIPMQDFVDELSNLSNQEQENGKLHRK